MASPSHAQKENLKILVDVHVLVLEENFKILQRSELISKSDNYDEVNKYFE